MRKFLLLSSAALSMFAVGCVSAEEVCESGVELACERAHECTAQSTKDNATWQATFGTSVADCKTKLTTASKCSEKKETDELCTGTSAGKKYNLSKASQCSDAKKAQSCADYNDTSKTPTVCGQICE